MIDYLEANKLQLMVIVRTRILISVLNDTIKIVYEISSNFPELVIIHSCHFLKFESGGLFGCLVIVFLVGAQREKFDFQGL